jgi:hypothetical protein
MFVFESIVLPYLSSIISVLFKNNNDGKVYFSSISMEPN